jgi:hypothetical protein
MVSPLYEFLNVFLKKQDVQKTLDKEYNQMVYLLYEFLNVLSERRAKSTTEWFLSCVNSGVSSER